MLPIINSYAQINDLVLQKELAISKINQILDFSATKSSKGFQKTASSGGKHSTNLIKLFSKMLEQLKIDVADDDVDHVLSNLSVEDSNLNKSAKLSKNSDRKEDIKIVSKSIKDSHYQIDVSKDTIVRSGKKAFMVSCYARDAYLGRYLIKRNYFYTIDREAAADDAYEEIALKMNAIKDRYYNDIIDVPAIFVQAKTILDGVISELEFNEDSLGATVNRK